MHGLGAGAVEFIICHAEVPLAFVEEKKISEVRKCFINDSVTEILYVVPWTILL